jgi:glycyl-tRNA synthetase beta subunit
VVLVEKLAAHQPDRQELVKGPPAERAFNPDGSPTPAAAGFARKNGVETSALEVREQDGGKYVFALVEQAGLPAQEVLSKALPALVADQVRKIHALERIGGDLLAPAALVYSPAREGYHPV